ncbi:MAG: T9SS type A sorting domain-containing protein [Bacteroidetes bacterium]|nr:T9SS type A sorting domain-containing protein [Bacteroidota bacterium]
MKKLYFTLLTAALGLHLNAQTLTQANHAPANGDVYSTTICNGSITSPGNSGAGVTYNFNNITLTSSVTTFSGTNSANSTYTPANIVVSGNSGESSYYLSSSNELKYFGGNIVLGGFPATITYTSPAVYAKYPMSLNTTTSSVTSGTLSALSNNGTFTGNMAVIADGSGTLILPGTTFTNVLRVVSSQTINFAIPSAGIGNGLINQVTYDFYTSGKKTPLFTIATSTVSGPPIITTTSQTIITIASNYLTGISSVDFEKENSISVFPNPSSSAINFETPSQSAKTISIYDINGKFIEGKSLNTSLKLDVSNYANGIYSYKIISADNNFIKSAKFTVTH